MGQGPISTRILSFAYNKDFNLSSTLRNLKAYNIVTGSASLTDGEPSNDENAKRRHHQDSRAPHGERGRETSTGQVYQELTPDVMVILLPYIGLLSLCRGALSSGLNLVDYASDGSTSEKDEEKETEICGDQTNGESNLVKIRSEQRFPLLGEPVCLTDDDICSLECKAVLLRTLKFKDLILLNQSPVTASAEFVSGSSVPEEENYAWDYVQHRWSNRKSSLSTYLGTTCQRPGHLAEDCLVAAGQNKSTSIPKDLLGLYRRCKQIGKSSSAARCNECQSTHSLATRIVWRLVLIVKCSKATCKVTDISDLLGCHYCFHKFYEMCTASWKGAGLANIRRSISCEDHFSWQRMNFLNAGAEDSAYIVSRHPQRSKHVQISEVSGRWGWGRVSFRSGFRLPHPAKSRAKV
ncbi:hypothetical protein ACJRO7_018543 [Eucalyptus globulus]|uniref:Uncharacterized protein n=1 Tax=Eucalyptus globulus TaxID=34317 RepID=A0ABD3KU29_EUCGL